MQILKIRQAFHAASLILPAVECCETGKVAAFQRIIETAPYKKQGCMDLSTA
jgi:hypothetical protein